MSPQTPIEAARSTARGQLSVLCARVSALIRQRWGRGPKRSRAYWSGPDAMLVILDDAHTQAERTLVEAGHDLAVLDGRRLLSHFLRDDLHRIAEEATGRRVHAVLSQSHVDPDVSVFVFLFAADDRRHDDEERLGDALRRALEETAATRALIAQNEQARRTNQDRRAAAEATRRMLEDERPGDAARRERKAERPDDA